MNIGKYRHSFEGSCEKFIIFIRKSVHINFVRNSLIYSLSPSMKKVKVKIQLKDKIHLAIVWILLEGQQLKGFKNFFNELYMDFDLY